MSTTINKAILAAAAPLIAQVGAKRRGPLEGVKHTRNQAKLKAIYVPARGEYQTVKKLKCRVCGGDYFARRRFAKFCSERCRRDSHNAVRRQSPSQRPCAACGEAFTPKRSDARYCGDACRQRAHRTAASST